MLDRALVFTFTGPATATGEDVVEFHCHGSRAVAAAIDKVLGTQPGCRRAEPGEFTRRALRNGRIDLAQAEALGELLTAETEAQRRHALRGTEGVLGRSIARWRAVLVHQAALIEAALAFEDEDEVASGAAWEHSALEVVAAEMRTLLDQPPVERLRDGIRVVLAGPPNAGKSTLLNALTGREVAIVSPAPGTTRDRIEVPVQRNGIAYLLTDTAGLRETVDGVEAEGIARAHAAMAAADVVVWLGDDEPSSDTWTIAVHARSDEPDRVSGGGRIKISAVTGEGLSELWQKVELRATDLLPAETELSLNARQRALFSDAECALREAFDNDDDVLVAESLRVALQCCDRVTGRTSVEDVLDDLFKSFCLGK